MRLALVDARWDCSCLGGAEHLSAALAVWSYREASACLIFWRRLGRLGGSALLAVPPSSTNSPYARQRVRPSGLSISTTLPRCKRTRYPWGSVRIDSSPEWDPTSR